MRRLAWLLAALSMAAASCAGDPPPAANPVAPDTTLKADRERRGDTRSDKETDKASGRRKGKPGGTVADCPSDAPPSGGAGPISLVDVTGDRGLEAPLVGMYGHANAIGDVNGDGRVDIFVGGFGDRPLDFYQVSGASGPAPDRLLLGVEEGRFRIDESFPEQFGRSSGAAFADLDDDGDPDLVVARNTRSDDSGSVGSDVRRGKAQEAATTVLRNDGGRLQVVAELATGLGARAIGVADFDGDGRLDLFISEDRWSGGSSVLLRNEGDFRFVDATDRSGLPDDVDGLGATVADLSLDGIPDIFVTGANRLFVNTGDGRFREADTKAFGWDFYGEEDDVAGVEVADLNRDGRPDIVLGQHFNSTVDSGCMVPVRVYLHRGVVEGDPKFEDVTERAGLVGLPTKAPHVEVADLDNDGWPDIVATAAASGGDRPAVFRNLGVDDGVPRFAPDSGLGDDRYWITGATADFDDDGRIDVFAVDPDPARSSQLLRNESVAGHWLEVEVGLGPGELGTVVEVYRAGQSGAEAGLLGRREIVAGRGNAAGGLPRVHFGLGDVTEVDVVVRPPRGGTVVERRGVSVDQRLCLTAGC